MRGGGWVNPYNSDGSLIPSQQSPGERATTRDLRLLAVIAVVHDARVEYNQRDDDSETLDFVIAKAVMAMPNER